MALRIANKINRQIVQNISRSISAKRDGDLEPALQKAEDTSKAAEVPVPPPAPPTHAVQYEVCRPRTTPITPFPNSVQNESDAVRQTVALQHLQPSMLPEYYKPPIEINSACLGIDPVTETEMQETVRYRKIEESNTFKNITLPLKGPKLASPFPDPVKVMQSHTVSDQEKAEQMLADSKMATATASAAQPQKKPSIRSLPSTRSYSTNNNQAAGGGGSSTDKKCKLGKDAEPKKCTKIKVPFCAPVKSIRCGKKKKAAMQCVKKQAPYPSYSETCHEDPQNKPSECKICPYRPDDHPTFTPPKNSFHTLSVLATKVKAERMKNRRFDDKKKGLRYESTFSREEDTIVLTDDNTCTEQPARFRQEGDQNPNDSASQSKVQRATYASHAKERPGTGEVEEEMEKAKTAKTLGPSGAHKASMMSLNGEMSGWLQRLKPEDILLPSAGRMHEISFAADEEKPEGGGRCKKFPFKECTFEIVKERKPSTSTVNKCPPKPKRKLITDCPAEKSDRCKRTQPKLDNPFKILLASDQKKEGEEKKKCPKINLDVCKDYRDEKEDPCKRKRTGKTLICPDDLLSKKPRNKKKKTKSHKARIPLTPPPVGRPTVSGARIDARISH